jgi:sugar/nucleoside kinase (ribokinase family)
VNAVGHEELERIFADADIVSMGYWSNMPDFDEFICKLDENYFKHRLPKSFFFDFANIKKRSIEALKNTFTVLSNMNSKIPVSLSLNEHEAILLFSYYNIEFIDDCEKVAASLETIRNMIGLSEIIVHTPYYAVIATEADGTGVSLQDYCSSPVITTGAGDTFNGGYIASCFGNLNIYERLAIANAATRFYICNGYTPDRDELFEEIKRIKKCII